MVLATIQTLCMICDRLLQINQAQQAELRKRKCNPKALVEWERETEHLREMLRRMEE